MADLPSGTVSLLFSDIEGSTALLSRLGPAYADALDAQRRILRESWAGHRGTELGTEGDSFFVAFSTAQDAVAAAVHAQRGLAAFDWPGGEQVRVRMGIHTGTPAIHDGGYVGMDVHRAARIAGAAHGGQLVLSEPTAGLVTTSLQDDVGLRDLGHHHLKDLAAAEHLFQVDIAGLQTDFAAVKSLGAASSLPTPTTTLVGRDGELAELKALLSSPEVRLVTLTGPGGSGKTRLAVGLARTLVDAFPDGVYFVPLAAVTRPDVMWTTIGEVLDVPPEGRIPPGFFTHVAHRTALFVLDNLEQMPQADAAVSQLLAEAPQLVVVVTSRRPLHVAGEHEHAVPTLELPGHPSLDEAERSGAVQMFVQRAQLVRPHFTLDETNAADVISICRSLDGLPLAIELAAARCKLLSPAALATRMDTALELKDTGVDRPTRQQTLRDTIAWSYELLSPTQQRFFRRLGVFAGGADFDAVVAVAAGLSDDLDPFDPFDMVADLVDASLVSASDGPDGEPRISMLETIRTYALDQLEHTGEFDDVRRLHANHYVGVAGELSPLINGSGDDLLRARRGVELEMDNFREALRWALQPEGVNVPPDHVRVALRLCHELSRLWGRGGYFVEARRWLELAISRSGDIDSPDLAYSLHALAWLSLVPDHLERGLEAATQSVAMWRRLDDKEGLSLALSRLAVLHSSLDDLAAARLAAEEAVDLARETDARHQLGNALAILSNLEAVDHNQQRSLELITASVDISLELGEEHGLLIYREIMACCLRELGRLEEAYELMRDQIPPSLQFPSPETLMVLAEDFGALLADLGEHEEAVQLLGAADAMRERHAHPRNPGQEAEIEEPFAKARTALTASAWERAYELGHDMAVEDALMDAYNSPRRPATSHPIDADSAAVIATP